MRAYAVTRFNVAPPYYDMVQRQNGFTFVYLKDFGRVEFNSADCFDKADDDLIVFARSFATLET